MSLLALAWLSEVGLLTWRTTSKSDSPSGGKVPWPSQYVATFVVFGSLSLVGEIRGWDRVAALAGWGFVLATVLNLVDPTTTTVKGVKVTRAQQQATQANTPPASPNPLTAAFGGATS